MVLGISVGLIFLINVGLFYNMTFSLLTIYFILRIHFSLTRMTERVQV